MKDFAKSLLLATAVITSMGLALGALVLRAEGGSVAAAESPVRR